LSFIAGCGEQAKCQVATNDNIAIFKGRLDFSRQGAAKNWDGLVQNLRAS
jgi:hypothetical protein